MDGATFKKLSLENWRERDPVHDAFGEVNPATREHRPMTAERWAELILAVELAPEVPGDVRDMWEAARGVLLYGWFFYPLYALGDEQLHRVADAAVLHAYQQRGGPEPSAPPTFASRLAWLLREGHIDATLEHRWTAIRQLRNLGSHATTVTIHMPGDAIQSLRILAKEIDALFAPESR
jgi:hypothetical protein